MISGVWDSYEWRRYWMWFGWNLTPGRIGSQTCNHFLGSSQKSWNCCHGYRLAVGDVHLQGHIEAKDDQKIENKKRNLNKIIKWQTVMENKFTSEPYENRSHLAPETVITFSQSIVYISPNIKCHLNNKLTQCTYNYFHQVIFKPNIYFSFLGWILLFLTDL